MKKTPKPRPTRFEDPVSTNFAVMAASPDKYADTACQYELSPSEAVDEETIEQISGHRHQVEAAQEKQRYAAFDAQTSEDLRIVVVDHQSASALVAKLYQEAETKALEEASLTKGESRLGERAYSVVLAFKVDLSVHLTVLGVGISVLWVIFGSVESASDGPGFFGATLAQ